MGKESSPPHKEVHIKDESFVHNLRFGDGDLLKDGTSDLPTGRTLKGRYIVRVGWDDVRGWFGVVSVSSFSTSCSLTYRSRVVLYVVPHDPPHSVLKKAVSPQPTT